MKFKTGPLQVGGALVLLVAITLLLSPAPPPTAKNPEQEKAKETEKPKQKEAPKISLDEIKQMLGSVDQDGVSKGLDKLKEAVVTTRDAGQKATFIKYAISLAQTDKRENVRLGALNMLSGVKDLEVAVPMGLVRSDASPQVREAALLALGRFPTGGPAEAMLRQYAKDPDPGLRNAAMISLTGMLSAAGQVGNAGLATLLGEQDNDAAAKSANALKLQGPSALPVLIKTLYTSASGPARHGAAEAIALICSGYNPNIDEFARQAQVTHVQEAGHRNVNPQGFAPLAWALKNDPYAATREIAAQGLGYLGDRRAAAPLAAALKDPDQYVRRRAAAALITVPARTVVPQLAAAALHDKVAEVRRFAVEALGWAGSAALAARDDATRAAVVPALNSATGDQSPIVRRYAAMQLGRIADPASLEALSRLVGTKSDPDPDVRWAAVTALGKLRDKRAEPVLVQCLADPSPQVSNSAERALQKLGIARQEKEGYQG